MLKRETRSSYLLVFSPSRHATSSVCMLSEPTMRFLVGSYFFLVHPRKNDVIGAFLTGSRRQGIFYLPRGKGTSGLVVTSFLSPSSSVLSTSAKKLLPIEWLHLVFISMFLLVREDDLVVITTTGQGKASALRKMS